MKANGLNKRGSRINQAWNALLLCILADNPDDFYKGLNWSRNGHEKSNYTWNVATGNWNENGKPMKENKKWI